MPLESFDTNVHTVEFRPQTKKLLPLCAVVEHPQTPPPCLHNKQYLSSFHLNGRTWEFYSQTQTVYCKRQAWNTFFSGSERERCGKTGRKPTVITSHTYQVADKWYLAARGIKWHITIWHHRCERKLLNRSTVVCVRPTTLELILKSKKQQAITGYLKPDLP